MTPACPALLRQGGAVLVSKIAEISKSISQNFIRRRKSANLTFSDEYAILNNSELQKADNPCYEGVVVIVRWKGGEKWALIGTG